MIAAAVASLVGLSAFKISEWANKKITELSAEAIGAGVAVALFLAWNLRKPIRNVFGTPRPRGDRLAIYIVRFKYDKDSRTLQERIEKTIHKDFGDTVQVIRTVLPRPPAHSEDAESESAVVTAAARSLLEETDGDLIIWGKLIPIGAGSCDLHFVSAEDDRPGSFGFRERMLLAAEFSAELGSEIAALAKGYAGFAHDNFGTDIVATLAPLVRRLRPLADHIPSCILSDHRGFLLESCGEIQYVMGVQSGENAPLECAIQLHARALDLLPHDRLPVAWAAVKRRLGIAISALGDREIGTEKLVRAAEVFREALGKPAFARERELCADTQSRLAQVLSTLGFRDGNAEALEQAVGAFNRALEVQTPDEQPRTWAATQVMLWDTRFNLALLEAGTEQIEQAVTAYREALAIFKKEEVPRDWGWTKRSLGAALALLGGRGKQPDRLREAIGEYEEGLEALEPFPLEWACTQEKRGEAFLQLAALEEGTPQLEYVVNAFNLAIPELTGRDPDGWATTEYNLGAAHLRLGEQRLPQVLDFKYAETALRQALSVWTSGPDHDMALDALRIVHEHLKDLKGQGYRNT